MKSLIKSFVYAFDGIKFMLRQESNLWIHIVAALLVIILGVGLKINTYEWIAVVFAIALVITTEIINTGIERVCDKIEPDKDEQIKIIKDIGAGAVLISAIAAFAIGLIVFIPKFF